MGGAGRVLWVQRVGCCGWSRQGAVGGAGRVLRVGVGHCGWSG